MNWNISKALGRGRVVAVVGVVAAVFMMAGTIGRAQSEESASKKGLQGTWLAQVTLRNCATNAPLGSFSSIVTFHDGGSLSESTASPAFAIGQRGPGHGSWAPRGHHTYSQKMVNLINFDTAANLPGTPGFNPSLPVTPGFFAGWATVTQAITLSDADSATSSGTNVFYKADGTQYRTGCSTSVATRFE